MHSTQTALVALGLTGILAVAGAAQQLPPWSAEIRADHPRLFFNQDTWGAVRSRALGPERAWYDSIKERVDALMKEPAPPEGEPKDLGRESSWAAFVYLVTGEKQYLDVAKRALETSLRFYEQCYEKREAVNWYSTSRVHTTLTWDWLYNDLTPTERQAYLSRLVRVLQRVYTADPPIDRENISSYRDGFYGVNNCKWFVGCTALGTGIEEELTREWLVWGYDENMAMLDYRRKACGDDGGSASPTPGYAFGQYPNAEQNFLYTWLSATGENLAPDWPHAAYLANYVIWNWIETGGRPLEFGWGDGFHSDNELTTYNLYMHMANIRQLYGKAAPEAAALARHVQQLTPDKGYSSGWFIYPFLLTDLEASPEPLKPERLPRARHFENMGQVFMRSGAGPDDTYCLFTAGGILPMHRHYDALNFVIYHRGHLALDSGTRCCESDNGQHLANYYAQTVAHNCVLVHQPGEPPADYWGGRVEGNYGGQHDVLGSVVKAFETNDEFVYVAGDATACYQHGPVKREGQPDLPEKVSLVTRQLVFLMPSHFVIFDRVTTSDPSYRKDWLLHLAHEPLIRDRTIRADQGQGRLFCRTLFPEDAVLTPVGGPGKQFWAAGKNWEIPAKILTPERSAMMGQWRLEVSPGTPRSEDFFLHVIQVGDQGVEHMDPVAPIRTDESAGVRVTICNQTWEVRFNTRGEVGGRIRLDGADKRFDRPLATSVTPQVGILATLQ